MAYKPSLCEAWQSENVRPGWICCACGHYTPRFQSQCYYCNHTRCTHTLLPAVVNGDDRRRRFVRAGGDFTRRKPIELQRLAARTNKALRAVVR
jgi:hypothetical protein